MSYAPPSGPPPPSAYAPPRTPSPGHSSYTLPHGQPQPYGAPVGAGGFTSPPQVAYGLPGVPPSFPAAPAPLPPLGPDQARYLGVEVYTSNPPQSTQDYNPDADVKRIYEACKGWGTDNKTLVQTLVKRSSKEMQILEAAYKLMKQKDLDDVLKKETSGPYRDALLLLIKGPLQGDAWLIKKADEIKEIPNRITLLTEILVARPPEEIDLLRQYFEAAYHLELDKTVLSLIPNDMGGVKELFRKALHPVYPATVGDRDQALTQDSELLRAAFTSGDSKAIVAIIMGRRPEDLREICAKFSAIRFGRPLAKQIKERFSGVEEDILVFAVRAAEVEPHMGQHGLGVWRDAKRIEDAMEGRGTDEPALIYRLVRAHWDRARFRDLSNAYYEYKGKKITLIKRIEEETSGNFGIFCENIVQLAV